jgi:pimeloyl-ACP methyl ester carboxylesterase
MVNGVKLHYHQAGSGPDLVMIHGLKGSLAFWELRLVPELSRNFRILTYDLRGHGQSDMPPTGYSSRDLAADLLALLDHLGVEQPHLVGHSLGGVVAAHLAAVSPDRIASLTISDSRIRCLQPSQKLRDWAHWPLWQAQLVKRGVNLDEYSEMDFLLLDQLSPPLASQATAPGVTLEPSAASRGRTRWEAFLTDTTARDDLKNSCGLTADLIRQISVPAHAIYGEYSFCGPTLARLQELLPDLKTTLIPRAGHFFPLTQPEAFLFHLDSFYKSLESRARERGNATKVSPAVSETDLKPTLLP